MLTFVAKEVDLSQRYIDLVESQLVYHRSVAILLHHVPLFESLPVYHRSATILLAIEKTISDNAISKNCYVQSYEIGYCYKTRPIAISRVLRANSDGPTDGRTDRRTDRRTDKAAYRVVHATKEDITILYFQRLI